MRRFVAVSLLALSLFSAPPALAHHVPGQNDNIWNSGYNGHGNKHFGRQNDDTSSLTIDRNGIRFSTHDLNVIIDWFRNQPAAQTRPRSLPPGLARQLRERGHLPPGLAMKALPPGLAERLGPCPENYDRVVMGNDVVLINVATGVIADILRGVIR